MARQTSATDATVLNVFKRFCASHFAKDHSARHDRNIRVSQSILVE